MDIKLGMVKKLVILGRLAGRNEHDKANRGNKFGGAGLKKKEQSNVVMQMKQQCTQQFECVKVDIVWYEPNMRRDPDNVDSARKVIFDALVQSGILPNDGWKQIVPRWSVEIKVDKDNPRAEIFITNAGE